MSSNQINDQVRRRASILQNILCRNPDHRDPPYQQPRITRRSLRQYDMARYMPPPATRAYLKVIEAEPDMCKRVVAG
jgi:hypothetical protein